ncbi:MAG: hypothetical protein BroJett018_54990 [Chloroflexota bacterium]|nr:MAG: hypothetical protein BroJett018_54990 [Chloroflexota bacterium]
MNKHEREFEELKQERDHWRRLAQERGKTLETLQIKNSYLGVGMNEALEKAARDIQELRSHLSQFEAFRATLIQLARETMQGYEISRKQFAEDVERVMQELSERKAYPSIGEAIMMIFTEAQNQAIDDSLSSHNKVDIYQSQGVFGPVAAEMLSALNDLLMYTRLLRGLELGAEAHETAMLLAGNYPLIAHHILLECESNGMPELHWINDLWEWITRNLPEPPAKPETLQAGLKDAYIYKQGKRVDISERQLRKSIHWYERIEALSRDKPLADVQAASPN